jgi:hypothetical protein
MSEYQYYEFRVIDRPLDKAAQTALRALSSRAQITASSFTNTYQWGDFKGDPDALMEDLFDLHLYLANWGSRRLMIRVPKRFIDRRVVDACLVEPEFAKARDEGDDFILDVDCHELDVDWDEGPGWLDTLAPLRADLLAGDSRLLYLLWLMAVEFDVVSADTPEPLPGIGPLTGPLEGFAAFFCIDPDLVQAAAERDVSPGIDAISPEAARDAISSLSDQEKTTLLSRLVEGDPHVAAELRAAVRNRLDVGHQETPPRTAGDLRARAEAISAARAEHAARLEAEEREQRARQEEQKRRERLLAIARRGEGVWRDVEAEIERSSASGYDRAAELLMDLRTVADERDSLPEFARRVVAIRERHARKARFLQRIVDLLPTTVEL